MKRAGVMVAMLAIGPALAWAQNPPPANPPPRQDSAAWMPMGPGPGGDPRRIEMMRRQIEERFGRMIQTDLELSEAEMQQLRAAMRANQDRRRDLWRRETDLRRGIMREMRPGEQANNDSLTRMLNASGRLRVEMAQSDEQFQRELAFLPPVKRVRLITRMRQFEERIREIRNRSMEGGADRGPGQGAGPRGPGPGPQGQRRPGTQRPI